MHKTVYNQLALRVNVTHYDNYYVCHRSVLILLRVQRLRLNTENSTFSLLSWNKIQIEQTQLIPIRSFLIVFHIPSAEYLMFVLKDVISLGF